MLHTETYQNGVRQVAIGLGLQPHGVELCCNVALRTGLVQSSASDFTQLGCNEKWKNTLVKQGNTLVTEKKMSHGKISTQFPHVFVSN